MIDGKKVIAIIPARGGSKRLPEKNIKLLMGKPLIAWTIEVARLSGVIDDVVVTTDDVAIAQVAKTWGARVPWMRPSDLATDTASSMDVIIHALMKLNSEGQKYDFVVLLQPTSPFRQIATIIQGIELCSRVGGKSVVAVSPADSHPNWCFNVSSRGRLSPIYSSNGIINRSQDLPSAYVINGSLYVSSVDYLKNHKTFFTDETMALIVNDKKEALDIDDDWDWMLAEFICDHCYKITS